MSELEGFVKVSREQATPDIPVRHLHTREDTSGDQLEVSSVLDFFWLPRSAAGPLVRSFGDCNVFETLHPWTPWVCCHGTRRGTGLLRQQLSYLWD